MFLRKRIKSISFLGLLLFILFYYGVFTHIFETDFNKSFHYPYDGDIEELVYQLRNNITPKVEVINSYNFCFKKRCTNKCKNVEFLRLVFLVKSAPEHFDRRIAIRSSWGYERRFSDVEIRRVFLIGERNDYGLQRSIELESRKFNDIVQSNFTDDYYNNTLKTMMGFTWAVKHCSNAKFYMFVDDDYYVSTKNLLRFLRNPVGYPKYLMRVNDSKRRSLVQFDFEVDDTIQLYSGYAFKSTPLRHLSSKWYVSLSEYPYDKWPPYVTAGAYILSREALLDMYYASFYTKHFKFDDIYVGLLAYKCKIEPFHSDDFHFVKLKYIPRDYEFVIASHGYKNPTELMAVWTQQRSLGNA